MATNQANLDLLIGEYDVLVHETGIGSDDENVDWRTLEALLIRESEWTQPAAIELVRLVRDYGSFFLRNAAALALAVGIEDGEKGL